MQTALLEKGAWKMSKWSTRFMSAAAIMVVLCGSMAQAAVITVSYVNIQTSTTFNFAPGTITNQGNNTGALSSLPVGSFFRFGLAVSVSGNPNNQATIDAWAGTPTPQPANLGLQQLGVQILSTDGQTGANIAAIQGNPVNSRNASTAVFANGNVLWSNRDPGDVLGNSLPGVAGLIGPGQGQVGTAFPLGSLNASFQNDGRAAGALATPGATYFNGLSFAVVGNAPVTLTPVLPLGALVLWAPASNNGDAGDPSDTGDDAYPTYTNRSFSLTFGPEADLLDMTNAGPIQINSGNPIPEPATAGIIGLALVGLVGRRRSK